MNPFPKFVDSWIGKILSSSNWHNHWKVPAKTMVVVMMMMAQLEQVRIMFERERETVSRQFLGSCQSWEQEKLGCILYYSNVCHFTIWNPIPVHNVHGLHCFLWTLKTLKWTRDTSYWFVKVKRVMFWIPNREVSSSIQINIYFFPWTRLVSSLVVIQLWFIDGICFIRYSLNVENLKMVPLRIVFFISGVKYIRDIFIWLDCVFWSLLFILHVGKLKHQSLLRTARVSVSLSTKGYNTEMKWQKFSEDRMWMRGSIINFRSLRDHLIDYSYRLDS